jgi:hypothetical protein
MKKCAAAPPSLTCSLKGFGHSCVHLRSSAVTKNRGPLRLRRAVPSVVNLSRCKTTVVLVRLKWVRLK